MVPRRFWQKRLESAWKERRIVWLSGVRRSGKTVLCQSLPRVEYFDCELPRVRRMLADPESFLEGVGARRIILDEVHRLQNPSELLKIAADHFPSTRILATGSSTLHASKKFRDTLAGRKRDVWLTPMCSTDLDAFSSFDLEHRLLHGGLPELFLSRELPERDFQEWVDAFWAKDVVELFRIERRASFQRFFELTLAQSGGIFDASRFARECEVSRPTISNYLAVLEATWVAHVIRPFSTRRATEIVSAPRVYGFDTGFVCALRGWATLRPEDLGRLWEHYVLNELHSRFGRADVRYWRDKRGHEVDFVLPRRGASPVAIECKWTASSFGGAGLAAFRRRYPQAEAWLVARDVGRAYRYRVGREYVEIMGLDHMIRKIAKLRVLPTP